MIGALDNQSSRSKRRDIVQLSHSRAHSIYTVASNSITSILVEIIWPGYFLS